jgi:hypothetical protein
MENELSSIIDKYTSSPAPRAIRGAGTGKSDSIPAVLKNKQGVPVAPAALSDGEFVITANAVSNIGGGSTEAGFSFFDEFMAGIEGMEADDAEEFGQIVLTLLKTMSMQEMKESEDEAGQPS